MRAERKIALIMVASYLAIGDARAEDCSKLSTCEENDEVCGRVPTICKRGERPPCSKRECKRPPGCKRNPQAECYANQAKQQVDDGWNAIKDLPGKAKTKLSEVLRSCKDELDRKLAEQKKRITDLKNDTKITGALTTIKAAVEKAVKDAGKAGASAAQGPLANKLDAVNVCFSRPIPEVIVSMVGDLASKAAKTADKTGDAVRAAVKVVTDEAGNATKAVTDEVKKLEGEIGAVLNDFKNQVQAEFDRIKRTLDGMTGKDSITNAKSALDKYLTGDFPLWGIKDKGLGKLWEKAESAVTAVNKKIADGVTLVNGLKDRAIKAGTDIYGAVKSGLEGAFAGLKPGLKDLLAAVQKYEPDAIALIKCIYDFVVRPKVQNLPSFDTIRTAVQSAIKLGKRLYDSVKNSNPEQLMMELTEKALADAADGIPKAMEFMQSVKADVRAVLVLEGLEGPEDERHDAQIRRLAEKLLSPVEEGVANLLNGMIPKESLKPIIDLVREPIVKPMVIATRMMILARSGLMKVIGAVVPSLLEGANRGFAIIEKAKPPDFMKGLLLSAFDVTLKLFGGLGTFFLGEMGLQESITQILSSVVTAMDEASSVRDATRAFGAAKDAKGVFASWNKLGHDDTAEAQKAAYESAVAARNKAQKDVVAKQNALSATEQEVFDAEARKGDRFKGFTADQVREFVKKAKAEILKLEGSLVAAVSSALETAKRAERLDPDAVGERVISEVWEKLSEAFFKATWDTMMIVLKQTSDFLFPLLDFVVEVVAAVAATILGYYLYTTDYGPLIVQVVASVVRGCLPIVQSFLNFSMAVIGPEIRLLVKDQFVDQRDHLIEMWRDKGPGGKRDTLKKSMAIFSQVDEWMEPIKARLRATKDVMALGEGALMTGPLGAVLKMLPPELVAALTSAFTSGLKMLRNMAKEATKEALVFAAKAVITKKASAPKLPTKEEIARAIVKTMKDPLIRFFVGLLPDSTSVTGTVSFKDLKGALEEALVAGTAGLENEKPEKLLDPKRVLKMIGEGVKSDKAQTKFAKFLAGNFPVRIEGCAESLETTFKRAVAKAADMIGAEGNPDMGKISELLEGGAFGVIAKIVDLTGEVVVCMVTAKLPAALRDIKEELTTSLTAALKIARQPSELRRLVGGGWKAIVAKVIELSHAPIVKFVLRDFPAGRAKDAVTVAVISLAKDASSADFFTKLASGGLPALFGTILGKDTVVKALAELLTAGISDQSTTAAVEAAIREVVAKLASGALQTPTANGIKDLIVTMAAPVGSYAIRQVTSDAVFGAGETPVKAVVRKALQKGLDTLVAGGSLGDVLRNVGGTILGGLKDYVRKLSAKLRDQYAPVTVALAQLDADLRGTGASFDSQVGAVARDLKQLSDAVAAAKLDASTLEVAP